MTTAQKVKQLPAFIRVQKTLQNGMIDLVDAAKWVDEMWMQGSFSRDEANEAVKILARVKIN